METLYLLSLSILIFAVPGWRRIFFPRLKLIRDYEIRKRLPFFDFLKGVAILAVLIIHVTYFFSFFPQGNATEYQLNFINNILRFAIPVFFIISGILLSPKRVESNLGGFYIKKFIYIFLPYIFVNCLLYIFSIASWQDLIYYLFTGNGLRPFYFIVVLAQFYFLYPLLLKFKNKNFLLEFAFVISFVAFLFPMFWELNGFPLFFPYTFFFVYGLAIRNNFLMNHRHKNEIIFWQSLLILYVIFIFLTNERYYNARLFYGLAILQILFYYKDRIAKIKIIYPFFVKLGKFSLWLYLLHFPVTFFVYQAIGGLHL